MASTNPEPGSLRSEARGLFLNNLNLLVCTCERCANAAPVYEFELVLFMKAPSRVVGSRRGEQRWHPSPLMSDAAEAIDELERDVEETRVFTLDGSSVRPLDHLMTLFETISGVA